MKTRSVQAKMAETNHFRAKDSPVGFIFADKWGGWTNYKQMVTLFFL